MQPVSIGPLKIGDGFPTVLMTEIGTFFNQDIDLASSYLNAAIDAGVALLKGEILHDADVCLRGSQLDYKFNHASGSKVENYRTLIERKVIPLDGYRKIFAVAKNRNVPFVASVYDFEGVDLLVEMGGAAIKIARHNINHFPLIAYSAKTNLPVIFDAGIVYLDEVARAVRCAQENGSGGVIVNHHPGANPAPAEAHNLRMIDTYKCALGVPVGLTCHFRGAEVLYAAIGAGANLLEKGVVDDPDRAEQDVVSALRLGEIGDVVRKVSDCWKALGDAHATPKEPRDLSVRKGLIARRRIAAGEVLCRENVGFAWPPEGISVDQWPAIDGTKAARDFDAHEVIRWKDVRFE